MIKSAIRLACLSLALLPLAPVSAATLVFTLTGSRNATFQLDSNPVPSSFTTSALTGSQVFFNNVAGTYNGVVGTANINFGSGLAAALNVGNASLGFTQFNGPVLFGGTPAAPVFTAGTYALNSIGSGASTLTISALAAVPEPATWVAMTLGFAGIGGVIRYRRRRTGSSLTQSARA